MEHAVTIVAGGALKPLQPYVGIQVFLKFWQQDQAPVAHLLHNAGNRVLHGVP